MFLTFRCKKCAVLVEAEFLREIVDDGEHSKSVELFYLSYQFQLIDHIQLQLKLLN